MEILQRVDKLFARRTHGIRPGLDLVRSLLAALGNPHEHGTYVHVAGTNGKGSVCAMLGAVLRSAGLRVGIYSSPHLVRLNERFNINGHDIDDDHLLRVMDRVEQAAELLESRGLRAATFFECTTAMAFTLFAELGVDVALIETGLGGRFDATNVIDPILSVITRIDLDHQEFLGDSIEEIAFEKAGIVKPGRPVALGLMPVEAEAVIMRAAAQAKAPLVRASDMTSIACSRQGASTRIAIEMVDGCGIVLKRTDTPLYQVENMMTAVTAVLVLRELGIVADDAAVGEGLAAFEWPARFQIIEKDPVVLLDGAHNPCGARALVAALKGQYRKRPLGIVVGMCADKDVREMLRIFAKVADRLWLAPLQSERSMDPHKAICLLAVRENASIAESLRDAMEDARTWARDAAGVVVVCGSLFLAGEALQLKTAKTPGDVQLPG